tara:strand:+ start:159 stop:506 length:348 start_codon:yes stop_codon:yes gene_type:complete
MKMKNLAPQIFRQRMIIEGIPSLVISSVHIVDYLTKLSKVLDMIVLIDPIAHKSEKFGWCGWINWETSGAHFYAWRDPLLFFSIDIYTCKKFNPQDALDFTNMFFHPTELVYQNV